MERLPLNKLNEVILLQREYNVVMFKIQQIIESNAKLPYSGIIYKENDKRQNSRKIIRE